ncbi:Outer membrane scaffolding protein for murein synthesis, MipA/OmpV family [Rhizobacter sp. OV335]|nr:Outer membrane scaffolding protein for murein synthesis, MipA/OmpV family [Rhizobacter sp. OV335]
MPNSLIVRTLFRPSLLAAALVATTLPSCAQSQTPPAPPLGLSGSVSLGVATMPRYEGSPNRRTLAAPDLSLSYRTADWGHVDLDHTGLGWTFFEQDAWRAGLLLTADPGRKDHDVTGLGPAPGDDRLRGMGEVRASAEAGVTAGYGPLGLSYRKSLGDRGHRGAQVDLGLSWPLPVTDAFVLSFNAGASWADQRYLQAYFGVTPEQSAASGYAVYTPKAGLHKADLGVGAEYTLQPTLKLRASAGVSALGGDAKNSPIVAKKTGASGYLGLAYLF